MCLVADGMLNDCFRLMKTICVKRFFLKDVSLLICQNSLYSSFLATIYFLNFKTPAIGFRFGEAYWFNGLVH